VKKVYVPKRNQYGSKNDNKMIRAKEYIHKETEETPPAQDPVSIEIKRIEKADKLQPAAMQADSGSMQSFTSEEEDKSSVHLRPLD
jgi:hypothetical protein